MACSRFSHLLKRNKTWDTSGSKDNVDVTVTVEKPDAPVEADKDKFDPKYKDGSGKPGDNVT
ncbi:hypothetical protein ACOJAZ_14110, partial [Corynebacterium striatum]|uniref:hypothetical protein n=1 Tax=Corynebacterium striatum TaxID=43770 RepID=UPI003B5AB546